MNKLKELAMYLIIPIIFLAVPLIFLIFLLVISKQSLDSILVIISLLGLVINNLEKDYPRIELVFRRGAICFINYLAVVFIVYGLLYSFGGYIQYIYTEDSISRFSLSEEIISSAKENAKNTIKLLGIPLTIFGATLLYLKKKITSSKGMGYAAYFSVILIIYLFFTIQDKQFILDWNEFINLCKLVL